MKRCTLGLFLVTLILTACDSEYEELHSELVDDNAELNREIASMSNTISELTARIQELESEMNRNSFDLQVHTAHGDDWRYWTYTLQSELLNELYANNDIDNLLELAEFLADYKSRQQGIGKALSFYNPLNVAAEHNDVELAADLLAIDPALIDRVSENFASVPDSPRPPITVAIESDSIDVVEFLLDHGATLPDRRQVVDDLYSGWPVNPVTVSPSYRMTRFLIDKGVPAIIELESPQRVQSQVQIELLGGPSAYAETLHVVHQDVELEMTRVFAIAAEQGDPYVRWIYLEAPSGEAGWYLNDDYYEDEGISFPERSMR